MQLSNVVNSAPAKWLCPCVRVKYHGQTCCFARRRVMAVCGRLCSSPGCLAVCLPSVRRFRLSLPPSNYTLTSSWLLRERLCNAHSLTNSGKCTGRDRLPNVSDYTSTERLSTQFIFCLPALMQSEIHACVSTWKLSGVDMYCCHCKKTLATDDWLKQQHSKPARQLLSNCGFIFSFQGFSPNCVVQSEVRERE